MGMQCRAGQVLGGLLAALVSTLGPLSGVGGHVDIILAHLIHRISTLNRSRKQETTCALRELASSFERDLLEG
jgi:hypothetical protein